MKIDTEALAKAIAQAVIKTSGNYWVTHPDERGEDAFELCVGALDAAYATIVWIKKYAPEVLEANHDAAR